MKKFVTLLLVCAMLVPSLAACSESEVNVDETQPSASDTSDSGSVESAVESAAAEDEAAELATDDLPDVTYGGYSYNIFTRTNSSAHATFLVEDLNAEVLNDSIYNRNEKIAERFDVVFSETEYSTEGDPTTLVMAGDQTYSLMNVRCTQANAMAQRDYCIDIDSLQYINLEKPYWDKELTESISFGERIYTAIGATNLTAVDYMNALLFNKSMLIEYNLEDLYTLVQEGKWTFDKFGEMAGAVTTDSNGDGVYDALDTWGLLGNAKYTHCSLIQAADVLYVNKDADNYPIVNMSTDERFVDVFTKIFTICNDNNAWYLTTDESNEATQYHNMFRNNQGLFLSTLFYYIESMRDMESEFGIVPYPKYDEEQADYLNRVNFFDTAVVPSSVEDPDRASIILEALTCESFNTVYPAYKDVVLKGKYVRDEESSEMVDYIFEHRILDMGDTYFCGDIRDGFVRAMFYNDDRDIVSTAKRREKVLNKSIEKMIQNYEAQE